MNILNRRGFLAHASKLGLAAAVSSLTDVPFFMKRAMAAEGLGLNGKKLLFIFLRGANDSLNSVIPIRDESYNLTNRPNILIPQDPGTDYSIWRDCDFPVAPTPAAPTFGYGYGIRLGNAFAALHPSLKFLAPLYNSGDLALVHRVAYPKQSRSHFDSQAYWETGNPNSTSKEGIFYRTILESGLANSAPLTGVSFQSSLPISLRGSNAAMTNLSDPGRYNLFGIPNSSSGNAKADAAVRRELGFPYPERFNRQLLSLQYQNMMNTLEIFASINFAESGNTYADSQPTDGDTAPYSLFPTSNAKNGGYALHGNDPAKYVVPTGSYSFFEKLKASAIVLNKTDATIAGTELDGFDTHSNQGGVTGTHANLNRTIAWAMYALKQYFTTYADKATWQNTIVVTLSEFGRTSVQNSDAGTDHAEAGVMFLAGGAVTGRGKGNPYGVFGISPADTVAWRTGESGSMFAAKGRYLQRSYDFRSVLGRVIRNHLGATQEQLNRIIPGYSVVGERLKDGGTSTIDGVRINGEPPIA